MEDLALEVGERQAGAGDEEAGAEAGGEDVAPEDVGAAGGAGAKQALPGRRVQFLRQDLYPWR